MSRTWKKFPLLLSAAVVVSACQTQLKPGLNALADGDYTKAAKHARTGLTKDSSDPQLQLLLANALVGQERYRDAFRYARKAFESGDLDGPAGRTLGKVYWELDQPVDAVRTWRIARGVDEELVPTDQYIRAIERAIDMSEKGADPLSELEMRVELASLAPTNPQADVALQTAAQEKLAAAQAREGSFEDAVATYIALSAQHPQQPRYPFERGRLLARLGDDDRSIAAFDEFVAIGDSTQAASRMQDVAAEAELLGAPAVALHFAGKAIAALPATDAEALARLHLRVGTLLLERGARDEGATHIREFVRIQNSVMVNQTASTNYMRAASVATTHNHVELATSILEEAIVDAEPVWRVTHRLAELYAQQGRSEDVERVLQLLVERSDDPSLRLSIGEWAAGRRNFELARHFLEGAVTDPKKVQPGTWLRLARVYAALGQVGDVKRSLNNYASAAPDKRIAWLEIAAIYRAQQMYDEAEKALTSARRNAPKDVLIANLLEEVYREWGRPAKVHETYELWLKARGNTAEDLAVVGERFHRQGQHDDALPYLKRAAAAGNHATWLQIADIYRYQHKERDMKEALDNYLKLAPNRTRALAAVLQRYQSTSWSHEAVPLLEELIGLEPRNVLHYEQLSDYYLLSGRDAEAFELWKRFISHSDNPIAALETMARRFQRQRHVGWMVQLLHQFIEGDAQPDPRLYRLLGDAYSDREGATAGQARVPDKAEEYYLLYLDRAKPSVSDLQIFAESMRRKSYWSITARAYERLIEQDVKLQPHHLTNFATALLHIGEVDRAEKMLAQVYEDRHRDAESAVAISELLFSGRRYAAAEPYLRAVLATSKDDALLRQTFFRLAEMYRNSDRADAIRPIINEYITRAQDPREARRSVQRMLETSGMWEEAVDHLRVLARDDREVSFELGENLYRTGADKRAEDAFREYATNDPNPGLAWFRVATFYVGRGDVDNAENAFRNSVSANPSDILSHLGLGKLLTLVGRIDEGKASFDRARSLAANNPAEVNMAELQALTEIGAFAQARDLARNTVNTSLTDRSAFYQILAPAELGSGDPVRSHRMADELVSAGLPLEVTVATLNHYGLIEQATALIDREISQGDHVLGGSVLLSNLTMFARLGGVDRVMRSAQPLLEGSVDGRTLLALGTWLEEEGHDEQAVLFIRRAVEQRSAPPPGRLASLYAKLGNHDEALRALQNELDTPILFNGAEHVVSTQYELLGESQRFIQMLEQLVRHERYANRLMPLLLEHYADDGDISVIVDIAERALAFPTSESGIPTSEASVRLAVTTLSAGVQVLAARGYHAEARALLDQAPATVAEHADIEALQLRVAVFSGAEDVGALLRSRAADLALTGDDVDTRIQLVTIATSAGEYEVASELVEPLLTSRNFLISTKAMRAGVRAARAANNLDRVDEIVATYLATTDDKVTARTNAQTELSTIGLDDRAYALAAHQATLMPTNTTVRLALIGAQQTGDAEGLARWARRWNELDRSDPATVLHSLHQHWVLRQDDRLSQALLEITGPMFGETLVATTTELRHLYRQGKVDEAREKLLAAAKQYDFDAMRIQALIETLFVNKLYGEAARVVAPAVPPEKLTVPARRMIGLSNMAMGFDAQGLEQLDQVLAVGPDPASEAVVIADYLLLLRKYTSALRFADIAVKQRPTRPDGLRVRGLARLAVGDVERAVDDIDQVLDAGLGRNDILRRASTIALRTGRPDVAAKYANQLFRTSAYSARSVMHAYSETRRGQDGIALVESTQPRVAAGLGVGGSELVPSLSQLYESGAQVERAHNVYRDAIQRLELTPSFASALSTYRNNLAYGYSTADQHVEEGIDLVLRALALSEVRHASYIDTLGWLHYRQGDYVNAEAEVRRALRASSGSPEELVELFHHLAVLREAQGFHGQSVWHQIFADSVAPLSD